MQDKALKAEQKPHRRTLQGGGQVCIQDGLLCMIPISLDKRLSHALCTLRRVEGYCIIIIENPAPLPPPPYSAGLLQSPRVCFIECRGRFRNFKRGGGESGSPGHPPVDTRVLAKPCPLRHDSGTPRLRHDSSTPRHDPLRHNSGTPRYDPPTQ